MNPLTNVTLSEPALLHNIKRLKRKAPGTQSMAVVKSNAYGHGLAFAVKALENEVDAFAVARLAEAVVVRDLNPSIPIVVLQGFLYPKELEQFRALQLIPVVHHESQVHAIERLSHHGTPMNVWAEVDLGMHRLGFSPDSFARIHHRLSQAAATGWVGSMAQLSRAEDLKHPDTQRQTQRFREVTENLEGPRSLAKSAGILAWPETHFDWIRPGLSLYGASPISSANGEREGLLPVMTVKSAVISLQSVAPNAGIGYNSTWHAPRQGARLAIAAIGYGDGYPREIPQGTPVLVNGFRAPIVGRVNMDMIAVDVSAIPEPKLGDPVTLFGDGLRVETLAHAIRSIPHAVLTRFGPKLHTPHVRFATPYLSEQLLSEG